MARLLPHPRDEAAPGTFFGLSLPRQAVEQQREVVGGQLGPRRLLKDLALRVLVFGEQTFVAHQTLHVEFVFLLHGSLEDWHKARRPHSVNHNLSFAAPLTMAEASVVAPLDPLGDEQNEWKHVEREDKECEEDEEQDDGLELASRKAMKDRDVQCLFVFFLHVALMFGVIGHSRTVFSQRGNLTEYVTCSVVETSEHVRDQEPMLSIHCDGRQPFGVKASVLPEHKLGDAVECGYFENNYYVGAELLRRRELDDEESQARETFMRHNGESVFCLYFVSPILFLGIFFMQAVILW